MGWVTRRDGRRSDAEGQGCEDNGGSGEVHGERMKGWTVVGERSEEAAEPEEINPAEGQREKIGVVALCPPQSALDGSSILSQASAKSFLTPCPFERRSPAPAREKGPGIVGAAS